jgi:uncharacterized protein (UPF0548 family)
MRRVGKEVGFFILAGLVLFGGLLQVRQRCRVLTMQNHM